VIGHNVRATKENASMAVPEWLPVASGLAGALLGGGVGHLLTEQRDKKKRYLDALEVLESTLHDANTMLSEGPWDTDRAVAEQNIRAAERLWRRTIVRVEPRLQTPDRDDLRCRLSHVTTVMVTAVDMVDAADRHGRTYPQLEPVWAELRDRAFSNAACALSAAIQGDPLPDDAMLTPAEWEELRKRELVTGADHLKAALDKSRIRPDPPVDII
jgi:hypothetical protein